MKNILSELEHARKEYLNKKQHYNTLINKLRSTYMKREIWRDENSPLILKSELNLMRMSYDYLKQKPETYDFNSDVKRATEWKSEKSLNYYIVYDENDTDIWGNTIATYILHKKFIKELPEKILIDIWKNEVVNNKYLLSFEKFKRDTSITKLCELMNKNNPNFYILNDSNLKIRNILIIKPKIK